MARESKKGEVDREVRTKSKKAWRAMARTLDLTLRARKAMMGFKH